jgi:heme exporter protein B
VVAAIIRRDLGMRFADGGALLPIIFFLLVATLFPFAVGPDGALLAKVGGGALWMAALLAALLPVERLIAPDAEAGVLDQLAVRGLSCRQRRCCGWTGRRWCGWRRGWLSAPPHWRRWR